MVVFPVIQNKVDISVCRLLSIQSHASADMNLKQMNEQDQKAFKLYGKVPGKNLLTKMQKASILKNAWARA